MKPAAWAEPVLEEMERNGYSRVVCFLPRNRMRIMFKKGQIRGTAEGGAEFFSELILRAACEAYELEQEWHLARPGEAP